ncbi:reverse transcriptase domain-containing protein [Williamsia sp. 1135]|uniref:reverse transcriptase domain-containing protein n=1 Tax=Williamsia sp. 1135 TaxID=1889262 RepID=UPI000A1039E3|nr:reverse transcriptase domain-containing protein [Williamsia sp. 1135]ORM31806.1 hypothetical protein BFL43_17170 [Williamsia sp. 1135]
MQELKFTTLDLATAAKVSTSTPLEHFPKLISDRCLENAQQELVDNITKNHKSGLGVSTETIAMPKGRFGTRPVDVISIGARATYTALVNQIGPTLPEESRATGWQNHRSFGTEGEHEYIVDLDVASCYEYIDHAILQDELMLRSSDRALSTAIVDLLGQFFSRPRGLPQMLHSSDRLADTYLSIIDRSLLRRELSHNRFADDIKIASRDWESANDIIEDYASQLRKIGLILSSEKTKISKRETLIRARSDEDEFFLKYMNAIDSQMTVVQFFASGPYGDDSEDELNDDDSSHTHEDVSVVDNVRTAARNILSDIKRSWTTENGISPVQRSSLGTSLRLLESDNDAVPAELLQFVASRDRRSLENICNYAINRATDTSGNLDTADAQWDRFNALSSVSRQSPWAKLWLLATFQALPDADSNSVDEACRWVSGQLEDSHEIVRAEAAWSLAKKSLLTDDTFTRVFATSSPLTQPGLVAAAVKQGSLPKSTLNQLKQDQLGKAAAAWAEK